ncbi:peroxiredoxin [Methanocella sp. MCL-LM]|uniref:peroxiredoxin n=1 Tax=Methanocella sp. MCL-LM TaxID=3412035 RepID=UPI003C75A525
MENIDSSAVRKDPSQKVSKPLSPGTQAPDFTLRAGKDKTVKLSDFRGRPVVIAFYPADFSPVCTDQLALYSEVLQEFQRYDAAVIAISVDGIWSHQAFSKSRNLNFPLLSDFEPKGEIARAYGVYREKDGMSERALFVIDADGVIRWSYVSPVHVNPGAEGILKALEDLKARGGRVAATV